MPCDSSYLAPSQREKDSIAVRGFLEECHLHVGKGDPCYGDPTNLDKDVARLCAHLQKLNPGQISLRSLELQIFWRDHQKADKVREEKEARARVKEGLRKKALAKLSPEEKKLLGLK